MEDYLLLYVGESSLDNTIIEKLKNKELLFEIIRVPSGTIKTPALSINCGPLLGPDKIQQWLDELQ